MRSYKHVRTNSSKFKTWLKGIAITSILSLGLYSNAHGQVPAASSVQSSVDHVVEIVSSNADSVACDASIALEFKSLAASGDVSKIIDFLEQVNLVLTEKGLSEQSQSFQYDLSFAKGFKSDGFEFVARSIEQNPVEFNERFASDDVFTELVKSFFNKDYDANYDILSERRLKYVFEDVGELLVKVTPGGPEEYRGQGKMASYEEFLALLDARSSQSESDYNIILPLDESMFTSNISRAFDIVFRELRGF